MAKSPTHTPAKPAAPDGTAANPVRVAIAPAPAPDGGFVAGEALTPGQRAGLDPLDPALDAEQAKHREHRTNMQTDHEAENALDPLSGGPSPAVTANAPLTAVALGAPVTDMSGRPPLSANEAGYATQMKDKLTAKRRADRADKSIRDERLHGWMTPFDMGIPGAIVKRIVEAGAPVESEMVPNGHFFPETGTRYRLK